MSAKAPPKKQKKSGGFALSLPFLLIAFTYGLPTSMIIISGLLPTLLCLLADREKGKIMTITVGALNLAAVMPAVFRLWQRGHTFENSADILSSPLTWLMFLLGALLGWLMAQAIPFMFVALISAKDKMSLDRIRIRQKQLIDEWGSAVTEGTNAPIKKAPIEDEEE